jgi:hypothetical protein
VKINRAAYPPDAFPLPFGDRPTGAHHDFERARDAGGIGGVEPGRGVSVELGKFSPILRDWSVAYRCANLGIDRRNRCDPF